MATLTIVIPVFNQLELTRNCLDSLFAGAANPHELIIIDNNSTDGTPEYLRNLSRPGWKIEVITNPKNVGVGSAFNQGIRKASGFYVALLNNDTWLMPGWDVALQNEARRTGAAMIGAYYDEKPFDPVLTPKRAKAFVTRNQGKLSRDWAAILMFFRKDSFRKIGLFDERYFVSYEDRDLRQRMDIAGLTYLKTGSCFIWHKSQGTRRNSELRPNYEQESLKKFMDKWGFDPRVTDNTRSQRWHRKWTKFKNNLGFL